MKNLNIQLSLGNRPGFSYVDETGRDCSVSIENASFVELLHGETGQVIRVSAFTGRTPKTYYSGNRLIAKLVFSLIGEGELEMEEVSVAGASNSDAWERALAEGCAIVFAPSGAGCTGIRFYKKRLIKNEFGFVEKTEPTKNRVHVCTMPGKISREQYMNNLIPSGNLYALGVKFSGWKSPTNLIESGELCLYWYNNIPYASKEEAYGEVEDAIKKHLLDCGFEEEQFQASPIDLEEEEKEV